MIDTKYASLIAKQLLGKTTSAEDMEIKDWIDQSEEHLQRYKDYQAIWSKTNFRFDVKNSDLVFKRIVDSFDNAGQAPVEIDRSLQKPYRLRKISFAVAAAIVVILAATFSVRHSINRKEQHEVMSVAHHKRTTPQGQKMRITLPDESIVWLNAESSIHFPERFEGSSRIVELQGEAFFQVKKDSLKPFIVKTDHMDVNVLGTSFNVNCFKDEDEYKVALKSGKVLVALKNDAEERILLHPGEGIAMHKKTGNFTKNEIDPIKEFGWKDGILYFKDANFEEIISKLSRWYGVRFEVRNYTDKEWAYSGKFKNEYLSTILRSMSFSKEFDYTLDQNRVIIKFK
ncbi:MAG: FecR domain-containing protein [Cytophagales bacterium]|nr:FecR domain-containing protein [Cytophagales bacterium]